jgi:hypothetical protein
MNKVKEITFVRHHVTLFEIKLAKALKDKGYKVNLISFYKTEKEKQDVFDKSYYFLTRDKENLSKISKLLKFPKFILKLRKIKKSIIIGVSEPNWFVTAIFIILKRKSHCKIYYPYDVTYFRLKNYKQFPWLERYSEKYNFRHCNGIIHKGPKDQLKWLPASFKTENIPNIQFLPYCDNENFIKMDKKYFEKKLSKIEGGIHLVKLGHVIINVPSTYPSLEVFKEIVKQKIYLHVYALNYSKFVNDPDYKKLQKNKYFKVHKPIHDKSFLQEISKYDWGFEVAYHNYEIRGKKWGETVYAHKISSHLEAGLPSIVNDQLSFLADVVDKNKFGIVIKNVSELSNKIKNADYEKIIEKIKTNRSDFTFKKNIDRLIAFIEQLYPTKKC